MGAYWSIAEGPPAVGGGSDETGLLAPAALRAGAAAIIFSTMGSLFAGYLLLLAGAAALLGAGLHQQS